MAQGQSVGSLGGRPARLTIRPGNGEESGADCASDDQLVVDANVAADAGPADQVVPEGGALQPHAVGVEVPGWDVLAADVFFEVADRVPDQGVMAVELVDLHRGVVEVGEERVCRQSGRCRCCALPVRRVRRTTRRRVTARAFARRKRSVGNLCLSVSGCRRSLARRSRRWRKWRQQCLSCHSNEMLTFMIARIDRRLYRLGG